MAMALRDRVKKQSKRRSKKLRSLTLEELTELALRDEDLTPDELAELTLRDRVKYTLKRKHSTQQDLAKKVQITPAYLSQIISGSRRTPLGIAVKLHDELGIPIRDFDMEAR